MIELKNINIAFGKHQVLKELSLEMESNLIHGIVGQNGSGKTTLFNALAGYESIDEGDILYQNQKLKSTQIGYLETHNFFYSRITAQDYLNLFPQSNPNFNLEGFQAFFKLPLNELVEHYSTGMKKKLALLAILKQQKDIFLLDEPFNGLDLETNKVLEVTLSLLKEKGKTVILSSHVLAPLLEVADYVHHLVDGQIQKSYARSEFDQIDRILFEQLKAEAKEHLGDAI
jgi:ABC-2 type transport system ATP-binding protein